MTEQSRAARGRSFWINFSISLVIIILVLVGIFSPLSGQIARHSAETRGFRVPATYADENYRYYYQHLSSTEQEAYRIICAELPSFPQKISIPFLTAGSMKDVFTAVSYDNPEFFFLAYHYSFSRTGAVNYFEPDYVLTKTEYKSRLRKLRLAADRFLRGAPRSGTDYDKELFVHDKLVEQTQYMTGDADMIYTAYGSLVNRRANCEGYARAAVYLLKKLGVRSYAATGTATRRDGSVENHMWNVVYVGGRPYMMDATFDDYSVENDRGANGRTNGASHIYFNLSWPDIAKNHTLDDNDVGEPCRYEDQMYFIKNGLYFSSYEQALAALPGKIQANLSRGTRSIEMRFSNYVSYNQAIGAFLRGDKIYTMLDSINRSLPADRRVSSQKIEFVKDDQYQVIRIYFV